MRELSITCQFPVNMHTTEHTECIMYLFYYCSTIVRYIHTYLPDTVLYIPY